MLSFSLLYTHTDLRNNTLLKIFLNVGQLGYVCERERERLECVSVPHRAKHHEKNVPISVCVCFIFPMTWGTLKPCDYLKEFGPHGKWTTRTYLELEHTGDSEDTPPACHQGIELQHLLVSVLYFDSVCSLLL